MMENELKLTQNRRNGLLVRPRLKISRVCYRADSLEELRLLPNSRVIVGNHQKWTKQSRHYMGRESGRSNAGEETLADMVILIMTQPAKLEDLSKALGDGSGSIVQH